MVDHVLYIWNIKADLRLKKHGGLSVQKDITWEIRDADECQVMFIRIIR